MSKARKELEEPFVLDQPRVLQLIRHRCHGVIRRYLDRGGGQRAPVKGAQVGAEHPAHACQQRGEHQISAHSQHGIAPPTATMAVHL